MRVQINLELPADSSPERAADLIASLGTVAADVHGATVTRTQVAAGAGKFTDADVLDRIALGMGTEPEWDSGDLVWIANAVGRTRPHPGGAGPCEYVNAFTEATGIDPMGNPVLNDTLSDAFFEEWNEARTCVLCGDLFAIEELTDHKEGNACVPCVAEDDGRLWSFVGHWENDEIVVEAVVEGRYQDPRIDAGYWIGGLFCDWGIGDTVEEAEAAVREHYENNDDAAADAVELVEVAR